MTVQALRERRIDTLAGLLEGYPDVPPQLEGTEEELDRVQGEIVDTEIPWGDSGRFIEEVTMLAGRTDYRVQVSCPDRTPFRLLFADRLDFDEFAGDTEGQLYVASETHIACGSAPATSAVGLDGTVDADPGGCGAPLTSGRPPGTSWLRRSSAPSE